MKVIAPKAPKTAVLQLLDSAVAGRVAVAGRRGVGLAGRRRTVTPRAATQTPKPVLPIGPGQVPDRSGT